jgi:dTDP-4-amino-4,6-dideoxygalactose transaminase
VTFLLAYNSRLAGLTVLSYAGVMQVKLLDLQAQYAPLREEIRRAMDEVCDAQALILGPFVERFEKNLAAYCGVKHAVGVTSGTDALLLSLMAIGIKPGDEVICPAFTFFATAGSVARLGAKPVFVDIEPGSFNLDPGTLKNAITKKTRAIMPVHLFGQIAKMDAINEIATKHGLLVIEDAAQAIGAKRFGKPACSMGFVGCLSFYPTKNLGAFGDAGAICTNDDALADKLRLLREHGMRPKYYYKEIGGMFRLAALQAAVLDVKLKYLNQWHEARRRNAAEYDRLLTEPAIRTPRIDEGNYSIYNQYCVRIAGKQADRDTVRKRLTEKEIGNEVYYPVPLHLQECFTNLGHRAGDFPESERACREVLALPIYPELPGDHLQFVARQMNEAAAPSTSK